MPEFTAAPMQTLITAGACALSLLAAGPARADAVLLVAKTLLASSVAEADVHSAPLSNRPACIIKVDDPEPLPDTQFAPQEKPLACEIPSSDAAPQVLPLQLQPQRPDEQKRPIEAPK